MSRFFALVNITVVAMTMIGIASSSADANREFDQVEKPIALRTRKILPRDAMLADSSFLHLFKHKVQYQKLDKIISTTTTSTTTASTTGTTGTIGWPHCICVPFYLCDSNHTIITDGAGIIDIRFRRCPDFQVCCCPPNTTTTRPPWTFPTRPTWTHPTGPPWTFPTGPPWTFPTATPTHWTFPPITFPTPSTSTTGHPHCICVDISLCDPNGIVGFYGEGTIVPRRHTLCPIRNQVCCRLLATTTPRPTTTVSTTRLPPGHTQLCFVCGNTIQCFTCAINVTPDGSGVIDPRFSQFLSSGNVCAAMSALSCHSTSVIPVTDMLGPLKNPTDTQRACYCVKTWLCNAGHTINPDGLGIIDPRFTSCSSLDEVCCRFGGIDLQGASATSYGDFLAARSDDSSSQFACGVQSNNYAPPQPFPADSGKTYFAEFPWMVALLAKPTDGGPYVFQCGASMINNGAVLTAAHCVTNRKPESLMARFGQWDAGSDTQPLPIREANILAIAVHPSYYNGGMFHDVAVLVLDAPITYSANIMPICLPEQGTVFPAGIRCYGTGWGSGSSGSEGKYQAELRKVELPIVDREDCQARLRGTKLGQYFQLHGSFICAGGEANRDTCRGDGGGPLICRAATGQFYQAGIVSWGIGCGDDVPAVYASVSQHRQWIDQQLATFGV